MDGEPRTPARLAIGVTNWSGDITMASDCFTEQESAPKSLDEGLPGPASDTKWTGDARAVSWWSGMRFEDFSGAGAPGAPARASAAPLKSNSH
jgi:hypothetical protein